jgi:hypothetical protein
MKKFIIIAAVILATFSAYTAKAQVSSYWDITGGVSIPTGQFANSNYGELYHENNQAGFAKTGYVIGLDGAWYIHKTNWALAATVSYQDQGQLSAKNVQALATGYQDAFDVDLGAASSHGRYQNLNILVGPQYSFVFSKLIVDVRANAGIIKSFSTPEIDVVVTDAGIPHPFAQLSSTATAFAYGGLVDLRYKLTKKLGIILKEDYVNSPGITIDNTSRVNNAGRLDTKQPISEFQTSLGLNFSF